MPTLFYRLFLDDERIPTDVTWFNMPAEPWVIVRSYDAFVKHIEDNGIPDFVSFDHDLGEGKTGMDAAKWLVQLCLDTEQWIPSYIAHTKNPVGYDNIESMMENGLRLERDLIKDRQRYGGTEF